MGLIFGDKIHWTSNHSTVAPAYPQTIHEHRAPTDDSVKLLREMEEAARSSVVGMCQIGDNTLNGVVVVFNLSSPSEERIAYIRFKFNGKDFLVKSILTESFKFDQESAVKIMISTVRDEILNQLTPDIFNALSENLKQTR